MRHLRHSAVLVLVVASCDLEPVQGPSVAFLESEYPVGDWPQGLAVANLDGDSGPDLVVANGRSGDVSVLLNSGEANFAASVAYACGDTPMRVAVGDLDGDGDPDLAVANSGLIGAVSSVAVLFNTGDGAFGEAVTYETEMGACSVVVGDFDQDGAPDLAVATLYGQGVSVLLNLGDGTFGESVPYAVDGLAPRCVVAEDLDGDGDVDLAVATDGRMQVVGNVSILLNAGDGTFTAGEAPVDIEGGPMALAVGDWDSDDDLDLAVVGIFSNGLYVLLNRGDGTFAGPEAYVAGNSPVDVAAGDLDGDGLLDLAVARSLHNTVSLLLNRGDGSFAEGGNFGAGGKPSFIVIGDFDGNGALDLATSNQDSNSVSILPNTR